MTSRTSRCNNVFRRACKPVCARKLFISAVQTLFFAFFGSCLKPRSALYHGLSECFDAITSTTFCSAPCSEIWSKLQRSYIHGVQSARQVLPTIEFKNHQTASSIALVVHFSAASSNRRLYFYYFSNNIREESKLYCKRSY